MFVFIKAYQMYCQMCKGFCTGAEAELFLSLRMLPARVLGSAFSLTFRSSRVHPKFQWVNLVDFPILRFLP
jgi:hypothetical protein